MTIITSSSDPQQHDQNNYLDDQWSAIVRGWVIDRRSPLAIAQFCSMSINPSSRTLSPSSKILPPSNSPKLLVVNSPSPSLLVSIRFVAQLREVDLQPAWSLVVTLVQVLMASTPLLLILMLEMA